MIAQQVSKKGITIQAIKNRLWKILMYVCILYNFHRYIFKYSHGGYPKDGYQQTPLTWQIGKFVILGVILIVIYVLSDFDKKIKKSIVIFYFFIFLILSINILSGLIYKSFSTDEIEYCIYTIMLLPMGIMTKVEIESLACEFKKSMYNCQLIIIISNWIIIYNYYVNKVLPFHAYEGVLIRFGGFWDDPNTLAIFSAFLFGYAIINKQYLWALFNVINIVLSISFGGYILLFVIGIYLLVKSSISLKRKALILILCFSSLIVVLIYSADFISAIYDAKRESVSEHTTVDLLLSPVPLINPIQFHETWFISLNVNYFPFSILIDSFIIFLLMKALLSKVISLQYILIIIFCVASIFLPFLYMFPINFVSLILLIFYLREVYL